VFFTQTNQAQVHLLDGERAGKVAKAIFVSKEIAGDFAPRRTG